MVCGGLVSVRYGNAQRMPDGFESCEYVYSDGMSIGATHRDTD